MFGQISLNIWALLVSALGNMVIGALWYSPILFGNIWLKLVNKKAEDISKKEGNTAMTLALIPAVVSTVGLWFLVQISGALTAVDGLILGSAAALAFSGMSMLNLVFFENRSMKLTLLNGGYALVSYNVAAVILTLWR
ncbi:MAG: DUF1761 domain-containing protein [Spirochaetales bacterium]|nr:DUF1761 domain-containing protein [Spirochaetales bacterium]